MCNFSVVVSNNTIYGHIHIGAFSLFKKQTQFTLQPNRTNWDGFAYKFIYWLKKSNCTLRQNYVTIRATKRNI